MLGALVSAQGPVSAYTLLDRLRQNGFRAPLQVYRALEKMIAFGLVHRLESLNSFIACAHPDDHACGHKHGLIAFGICETCGRVDEFCDAVLEQRLTGWARDQAFKSTKATIELRGICANCNTKPAAMPGSPAAAAR